ncbi:MAG: biotin/lipoyl-binding protein [Pirellulaceae bacterium]
MVEEATQIPDPAIRDLVLHRRQIVFPVRQVDRDTVVVVLFQQTTLPEHDVWSLDDVWRLQSGLDRWNHGPADSRPAESRPARPVVPKPLSSSFENDEHASDEHASPSETDAIVQSSTCSIENDVSVVSEQRTLRERIQPIAAVINRHRWAKVAAFVALCASPIIALFAIPADFDMQCEGKVQPILRDNIIAQADGMVEQLLVSDGDWVGKDQVLLTLSNDELAARIAEVAEELQNAKQLLRTNRLQRLKGDFEDPSQRNAHIRESNALQENLESVRRQHELLLEEQAQLVVKSPFAGQVVVPSTAEPLTSRPVEPGQVLLTIVDPQGPWELELKLPGGDRDQLQSALNQIAETSEATNRSIESDQSTDQSSGLETTYILSSHPSQIRTGTIQQIALESKASVDAADTVRLDFDLGTQTEPRDTLPRAGTPVIARVHIGRRSIGYCKLYEFFHWAKHFFNPAIHVARAETTPFDSKDANRTFWTAQGMTLHYSWVYSDACY